jgi:hypothetical protein
MTPYIEQLRHTLMAHGELAKPILRKLEEAEFPIELHEEKAAIAHLLETLVDHGLFAKQITDEKSWIEFQEKLYAGILNGAVKFRCPPRI